METEYIYESPDGGHTIYRRKFYSTQRELILETPDDWNKIIKKINWTQLAKQYPAIEDKLQELLMLKNLIAND